MTAKGIYIYGIVPLVKGNGTDSLLDKSDVYVISYLNISAFVSDMDSEYVKYTDKESLGHLLVHHQKTIEDLKHNGFNILIPMKLGTIVNSRDEVLKILANGNNLINDILNKIEHLTEIDIAVIWADFSGILKEIAFQPDIIALKEEIVNKSNPLFQVDQVKIGMLMQNKIKEKNTNAELRILDLLSQSCIDIKTHEVMNDEMITNSAFLIDRNKADEFEQAIDQLDEEFNGRLKFKLIGPLPCYSFYTIEVKELNTEQVVQAKKELELKDETSESEIKRAYLEKARLFHPDAQVENKEERFNKINKAYHTLIDYSVAVRQLTKADKISLAKEKLTENLMLVKIKE